MAALEVTRKMNFVGTWLEDIFSDALLFKVASHAKAEKGKSVKVTLSSIGLRVKRTKIFQDSNAEFYPLAAIRTAMCNPRMQSCVLFVVADPKRKYKILAFRSTSDSEAIHMYRLFQQIQHESKTPDVEMQKKTQSKNWTLAHRTSHNANRHLAEIFNEQKQTSNGAVEVNHQQEEVSASPVTTDASAVLQTSYSRQNSTSANIYDIPDTNGKVENTGEEFVIETEVDYSTTDKTARSDLNLNMSNLDISDARSTAASEIEIAEFKDEINHLTEEVKGLKTMIAKMSAGDSASINGNDYSSHTHYMNRQNGQVSGEPIYAQPVVMRHRAKTFGGSNMVTSRRSYAGDPWASHKRLSQASHAVLMPSKAYQMNSTPGSLRIKSDASSLHSFAGERPRSATYRSYQTFGSTVERPIEQTYAKPVVWPVQRHQVHTIGRKKKSLTVHQPLHRKDMDIML